MSKKIFIWNVHINDYDACYSSQVADKVVFSTHTRKKLLRVAYIIFMHCPIKSVKIPQNATRRASCAQKISLWELITPYTSSDLTVSHTFLS